MTSAPARALAALVTATVAASFLQACIVGGPGSGYTVTAQFTRAVALYEQSNVIVMGITVGSVTDIEVHDDHLTVEMRIQDGVPLPADVRATIVPLSLIGERNVVLGPAWQPGMERAGDGLDIPVARTSVPVEPDEALTAVTELLQALDPDAVARVLDAAAGTLDGQGAALNDAIGQLARLAPFLAAQDDDLLTVAGHVRTLAGVVEAREQQISDLLADLAEVATTLTAERDQIANLLGALVRLTDGGNALLAAHEITIPGDLASLAQVALTIQVNADHVQELVATLDDLGLGVVSAYDPVTETLRVRGQVDDSVLAALAPLLDLLGPAP